MASFKEYFPKLLKWEGVGYENVPGDNGGPTNTGIILSEWIAKGYDKNGDGIVNVEDLKLITVEDAEKISKSHYWDKLKCDQIKNQSIAEFIADFAFNCGTGTAARKTQKALGIKEDGIFGNQTLSAIDKADQENLFNKLKQLRTDYYLAIVNNNPSQKKFIKGWLNRTNSFKFVK